ncbi:hypothetical protein F4561_000529 [Lipingzhangella halophila]|uniref:Uncharacterized protein n=1 Tax=Lipingzhangella halophila TaxID=1783352 RepID=A0A7W7RD21_9ACTN|nr:hypothetical protein [Lipingzhangella halophila]
MGVRGAAPEGAARTVVGRPPRDRFWCPGVWRPTTGVLARGWARRSWLWGQTSGETRRNGRVWVRGPRRGCPWGHVQRRECPRGHSRRGPSPRTSAQSPSTRAPPPDGSTGARKGTVPTGPAALAARATTHPRHRFSSVSRSAWQVGHHRGPEGPEAGEASNERPHRRARRFPATGRPTRENSSSPLRPEQPGPSWLQRAPRPPPIVWCYTPRDPSGGRPTCALQPDRELQRRLRY